MKERLVTLNQALHHVCELMECYRALKGKPEFAKLISDDKYAALVCLQIEIFDEIRTLEKQNYGTAENPLC